ncbi:MAG: hypothetical protein Q8J69_08720 [Sphingobacteriaceae bacterium]|nr:hypothetical protein [Sphingobacteriaceae bacterium]
MSKKYLLLLFALWMGCSAPKKVSAPNQAYFPMPLDQVLGHLELSSARSFLYVPGDSLYFLDALRGLAEPIDLAGTEAQWLEFLNNSELSALSPQQVILSKGGLRTQKSYSRILVDRSKEALSAQEQVDLLELFGRNLESEGLLVLLSPKHNPKAGGPATQKANTLLTEAGSFRKSSLDTTLSPTIQALILLK